MPNPLQQIPANVRRWLYLAWGVAGLILGACQVADVAALGPVAVDTALEVLAYVGLALGFTAAANVTQEDTAVVKAPANVEVTVTDDESHLIRGEG